MTKNISLLLTALLSSYAAMYLSEKMFRGHNFRFFAKAMTVVIVLTAVGILSAAVPAFTTEQLSLKAIALSFALFVAAYFCFYPATQRPSLKTWMMLMPVLFTFCIFGFYQSFTQSSSLPLFYMYLCLGTAAGFGLSLLLRMLGKNQVLHAQNLAFLLASYCVYLLMESEWSKGSETISPQTLARPPDAIRWTTVLLLFISFCCGLFLKSKNKTSC